LRISLLVLGAAIASLTALAATAGANAIVAGSAIFGSSDYAAAIARIRHSASATKAVAS